MYQVSVRRHFDAAHALRGYKGKCENMHGHRYEVVVGCQLEHLDEIGLAVDYGDLKRALDEILEQFDHHCLNDLALFAELNPSSENIARLTYEMMADALPEAGLVFVEVYESPDAWVRYSPNPL